VVLDEDGPGGGLARRSERDRKEKVICRVERPGSSSSGGLTESGSLKSPDKVFSRRDGPHDYKSRKEEEYKVDLMVGHKRKRDLADEAAFSPDPQKSRRKDLSLDSERHHCASGKEGRYHYSFGVSSTKESDHYHSSAGSDRKRRLEAYSVVGGETSQRKSQRSQTPEPPESGGRGKSSRSYQRHEREEGQGYSAGGGSGHKTERAPARSRSLDWTAVQTFSDKANSKLRRGGGFTSVLDQFKPGVVLAELKVSQALAGDHHYSLVRQAILGLRGDGPPRSTGRNVEAGVPSGRTQSPEEGDSDRHSKEVMVTEEKSIPDEGSVVGKDEVEDARDKDGVREDKCEVIDEDKMETIGEAKIETMVCDKIEAIGEDKIEHMEEDKINAMGEDKVVPFEEEKMEDELSEQNGVLMWEKVAGECLSSCRRALTAADDYAVRRRLRKDNRVRLGVWGESWEGRGLGRYIRECSI